MEVKMSLKIMIMIHYLCVRKRAFPSRDSYLADWGCRVFIRNYAFFYGSDDNEGGWILENDGVLR